MTKATIERAKKNSKKWHDAIRKKVFSSPKALVAYEHTKKEVELSLMLRKARKKSNLSQQDIAERMKTSRTSISRLESSDFGPRNSPSINTLLRYAHALGYTVKINLVHEKNRYYKSEGGI
ncbi:MAG: DNA-binding protein [Gammaproteobacteria bacterium]|jgi:DNA-binding XRE family transcriptional regulator|nr:DNA-binding protein [Gammaproteobacteria bacterium]